MAQRNSPFNAVAGVRPASVGVMTNYDDVKAKYAALQSALDSVQALWAACEAMPGDPINDEWKAEREKVTAFLGGGPSWWFWEWQGEYDTAASYITEMESWRQKFAALPACQNVQAPPPIVQPPPSPPGGGLLGDLSGTAILLVLALMLMKEK